MSTHYGMTKAQPALTPPESLAIRLYCIGEENIPSAAARCSIKESRLRNIIRSDLGQQEIARIRAELDDEFINLQRKVTEGLRLSLESKNPAVVLAASKQWLTARRAQGVNVVITIEDVLKRMMESAGQSQGQSQDTSSQAIEAEFKEIPLKEMK